MSHAIAARRIKNLAALLEIDEADPQLVASTYAAAEIVALEDDRAEIERMIAAEIAPASPAAADAARAILNGSTPPALSALDERYGEGAARLLDVVGLGPALARRCIETLGVGGLEELEEAAKEGRLTEVKGIGRARAAKLVPEIEVALASYAAEEAAADDIAVEPDARSSSDGVTESPGPVEPHWASDARSALRAAPAESPDEVDSEQGAAGSARCEPWSELAGSFRAPGTEDVALELADSSDALVSHDGAVEVPIEGGVADFVRQNGRPSAAQALMETELYPRYYEDVFRPFLTRLVTGRSIDQEVARSVELLGEVDDGVILDVATGTGEYARALAAAKPGRHVIGLDISRTMLERATEAKRRSQLTNLVFVRGDAHELPLVDGSIAGAHCAGALHLMSNWRGALDELARVCAPGAPIVIGTFVYGASKPVRGLQSLAGGLSGFHWFSERELTDGLDAAGFDVGGTEQSGLGIVVTGQRR